MKNIKHCVALPAALLLILCFTGCGDDPAGDMSIEEITIYNIPATIPVDGNETTTTETFRVYLNASDFMDETKPPKAKGLVQVTNEMLQSNGTYTVTIQLKNPNSDFYDFYDKDSYNPDPNFDTGPWSGTALFFSIMISPQDTRPHGKNAVWAKGNYDLNREKGNWNWNNPLDFRVLTGPPLNLGTKLTALYDDIIIGDPYITK